MNDSMKIEQYQSSKTIPSSFLVCLCIGSAVMAAASGCRGTAPSLAQTFSGLGGTTRVPPPATGSFQVPGSYSGSAGSAPTSSNGLGGSSFNNGVKTSQNSMPTSNFINSISNAQNQILTATNNARNSVNRAADGINSSVEQASARVDRLGEGVSQAGAILTEAARAPIANGPAGQANDVQPFPTNETIIPSSTGRIGDSTDLGENASWRAPIRR